MSIRHERTRGIATGYTHGPCVKSNLCEDPRNPEKDTGRGPCKLILCRQWISLVTKPNKSVVNQSGNGDIDAFLEKVESFPTVTSRGRPGRLIFAMDATASRAPTWDMACELQGKMFTEANGIGELDIQLVFFRGYKECKASAWLNNAIDLLRLMTSVTCLAGRTQIERVLKHALSESKKSPVDALVYVGDSMEESVDKVGELAGQLRLSNLPLFIFQEGHDIHTSEAFRQIAQLSGGAHCSFDNNSAGQLGKLLTAVALYATGGVAALGRYSALGGPSVRDVVAQIEQK